MSTPLVTALRESCGYLRDDGYHQTAQLMTVAADEIERLNQPAPKPWKPRPVEPRSRARRPAGAAAPDCTREHGGRRFPSPERIATSACLVRRPRVLRGLRD